MAKIPMSPTDLCLNATKTSPGDLQWRADAIGSASLFRSWPEPARLRLARNASVATHAPGAVVVAGGPTTGVLTVIVDGSALACVTEPEGRRATFKMAQAPAFAQRLRFRLDS